MTLVVAVTVPNSEVELGDVLTATDVPRVAFDPVVPASDCAFEHLWAYTGRQDEFRAACADHDSVESIESLHLTDERGLYSLTMQLDATGFLSCLTASDLAIIHSGGSPKRWEFRLRFPGHEALEEFNAVCESNEVTMSIQRLFTGSATYSPAKRLTPTQWEIASLALERGYFDVPRETTILQLAEELDISDQAVSEGIRRAMRTLTEEMLLWGTDGRGRRPP